MKNQYLEYYGKHKISPVRQNLSNFPEFLKKREKLYRQLGMPTMLFHKKDILEVGPGSGFNTLAFFQWMGEDNKIELVEANPKGIADMKTLFEQKGIATDRYEIHECTIENFINKKKYDIIIAEGFIHAISNAQEIVQKLCTMLKDGGVIVITCIDKFGIFVEEVKRFIANITIKDIDDYDKKVIAYTKFFEPQFSKLKGMSRSVEDWVKDNMLSPVFYSNDIWSISDSINMFSEDFYILGTSQKIFTDYSWYKDLDYNERESIIKQFRRKQHNFMLADGGGEEETLISEEENYELCNILSIFRENIKKYEKTKEKFLIEEVIGNLNKLLKFEEYFNAKLSLFIKETIDILKKLLKNEAVDYHVYKEFYYAIGRAQQYLSMVKKIDYA